MHCNECLLSLLLLNVIGDVGVVEMLPPLVCFVVFMLDKRSFSTYPEIIAKLAISFYISFYSWDLTNLLLMCVEVMKQGMIEGFIVFLLSLLCTLCLNFWVASFCWLQVLLKFELLDLICCKSVLFMLLFSLLGHHFLSLSPLC